MNRYIYYDENGLEMFAVTTDQPLTDEQRQYQQQRAQMRRHSQGWVGPLGTATYYDIRPLRAVGGDDVMRPTGMNL